MLAWRRDAKGAGMTKSRLLAGGLLGLLATATASSLASAQSPAPVPAAALPIIGRSPGARPTPTPLAASPAPNATAAPAEVTATAFYVAPGEALTALAVARCVALTVGRKPAKLLRADPASG